MTSEKGSRCQGKGNAPFYNTEALKGGGYSIMRIKLLGIFILLTFIAFPAKGLALTIDLNVEFDGVSPGDYGDVILSLSNVSGDDAVLFTIDIRPSAGGAGGANADLQYFYLNIFPDPSPLSSLNFVSCTNQSGGACGISFLGDVGNPTTANGDGAFDYRLDFGSGGAKVDLTSFTAWLPGSDLTIGNFADGSDKTKSVGGSKGQFTVAAHIQSTSTTAGSEFVGGNPRNGAQEVPIPEPTTALLLGSGLLGLLGFSRQRFLKK
jgi:hypothetical protein